MQNNVPINAGRHESYHSNRPAASAQVPVLIRPSPARQASRYSLLLSKLIDIASSELGT